MRDSSGRLEQHQAAGRIAGNDAPAKCTTSESEKIAFVVIAAEREFKAVLASSRTVTSARAATIFSQDGLHVIAKAPLEWFVHGFDFDLNGGGFFAGLCDDGGGAVFERDSFTFFDADKVGVAGDKFNTISNLADELIVAGFFEDELLAGFRSVECDGGGDKR